ncbi:unnamed protein product [Amoebophrya sp. A25]|nr:unnamed protein product [Amoebophrya sp. A25]|eukprot:GSA25T00000884001.1
MSSNMRSILRVGGVRKPRKRRPPHAHRGSETPKNGNFDGASAVDFYDNHSMSSDLSEHDDERDEVATEHFGGPWGTTIDDGDEAGSILYALENDPEDTPTARTRDVFPCSRPCRSAARPPCCGRQRRGRRKRTRVQDNAFSRDSSGKKYGMNAGMENRPRSRRAEPSPSPYQPEDVYGVDSPEADFDESGLRVLAQHERERSRSRIGNSTQAPRRTRRTTTRFLADKRIATSCSEDGSNGRTEGSWLEQEVRRTEDSFSFRRRALGRQVVPQRLATLCYTWKWRNRIRESILLWKQEHPDRIEKPGGDGETRWGEDRCSVNDRANTTGTFGCCSIPKPSSSTSSSSSAMKHKNKSMALIFLMHLFVLVNVCFPSTEAAYFHVDPEKTWVRPLMLPWEPLRGTKDSILVTWTTGWNPHCTILRSVLQQRYPNAIGSMNIDLRNRGQESSTWYNDTINTVGFSPWTAVYEGPGKAFESTGLLPGHPYEYRVKTIGYNIKLKQETESPWSVPQMVHTNYDPIRERFGVFLQGATVHNMDDTIIEVDSVQLYRRRDEKGLVLAVFSRLNMQLIWLKTYNTFNHPGDSNAMASDIRKLDQSHFVAVVSTDAWEWNVTPGLIRAMEFCGAFHFATWVKNFGGTHTKMPTQTGFDVDQTSTQGGFGHPYSFWGIPGIGTGNGWEGVAWPSSHYLMQKLAPNAVIRLVLYMDYVVRHYYVSLPSTDRVVVSFQAQAIPPPLESLHNPYTFAQRNASCEAPNCRMYQPGVKSYIQEEPFYKVYHGELRFHMDRILEANRTVDPHYYHFFLFTNSSVYKFDPRPSFYRVTELERIWGGPSERYFFNVSAQQWELAFPGIKYADRFCPDLFHNDRFDINPITCRNTSRAGMTRCCDYLDFRVGNDPSNDYYLGLRCGVGVVPTLCNETHNPAAIPQAPLIPAWDHRNTLEPVPNVYSKLPPTAAVMAASLGLPMHTMGLSEAERLHGGWVPSAATR